MNKTIQTTTIGILGGGQLGRMLLKASTDYGFKIKAMDSDNNAPIKNFLKNFLLGDITNYDQVVNFGKSCDVVTIEIENVNTEALYTLENMGVKVYPQAKVIETIKNKVYQKQFYKENNIPTAPFEVVKGRASIEALANKLPFVNKRAYDGYDGKGVQVIRNKKELSNVFDTEGIIEKFIPFQKEISIIIARSAKEEIVDYPAVELISNPNQNLVDYLLSPANISDKNKEEAKNIAISVAKKLKIVGLLAVEMFITKEGKVLVNEVAPRPHNSGHQTIEANITSQYEQHLRAILGMPLGGTKTLFPSAMINLLGEEGYTGEPIFQGLEEVLKVEGLHLHLYGKKETRPFRKMGHITITDFKTDDLKRKINFVKKTFKITA